MALTKADIVNQILAGKSHHPTLVQAKSFAPSNIALVKYWGKREQTLNLPLTSSLSVALGNKGTTTSVSISLSGQDEYLLNGSVVDVNSKFAKRLNQFLDLFRSPKLFYKIDTISTVPIAAGLASSASGFAALVKALDQLYAWNLSETELSILARLGSGSACRSIWNGFVEWQMGTQANGMDSHGQPLHSTWADLSIGLLIFTESEKSISSRDAMQRTVETSSLFQSWPKQVAHDLLAVKTAIHEQNFSLLGQTAEHNALSMHATMLSSWPPVLYSNQETLAAMQKVWQLRSDGIPVYFTQDAGPNLKLLFLKSQLNQINNYFPNIQYIPLF